VDDPIARFRTFKVVNTHDEILRKLFLSGEEQAKERLLVAFHEAAHATIYLAYHRRFICVSMVPNYRDGSAGRLFGRIQNIAETIALAGMAAELLVKGEIDLADE